EKGMARTGIAINTAVFAAAVGIDRAVETDIRRVVPRNDRARRIDRQCRRERRRFLVGTVPAVVKRHASFGFQAPAVVARSAASLARPEFGRHIHGPNDDPTSGTDQELSWSVMPQLTPHPPATAGPVPTPLEPGEGLSSPSPRSTPTLSSPACGGGL